MKKESVTNVESKQSVELQDEQIRCKKLAKKFKELTTVFNPLNSVKYSHILAYTLHIHDLLRWHLIFATFKRIDACNNCNGQVTPDLGK